MKVLKTKAIIILLILSILFIQLPTSVEAMCEEGEGFFSTSCYRSKQFSAVLLGVPGGSIIGATRGFGRGSVLGTDYASEFLGNRNGSLSRGIGFLSLGSIVGALGVVSGLIMGAHDGVAYGISDPYSERNFSLQGDSFTDYPLLDE